MIKIKRESCPASLNKPENEIVEGDCTKQDVKDRLLKMQMRKCCYCERDIGILPEPEREVEHYVPKHLFRDDSDNILWGKANQWDNLLYACGTCNGRKSKKNPINAITGEIEIINPSTEIDPEEYIGFVINYPIFDYEGKKPEGLRTIEKLRLANRKDLIHSFRTKSSELNACFDELINAMESDDNIKMGALKSDLRKAMSAHIPHVAFIREYVRQRLKKLNNNDLPLLESRHNRAFPRISIDMPAGNEVVF
ncbi:MAG: HNH endonuclease [Thermodesulfovibrionales bacterium]